MKPLKEIGINRAIKFVLFSFFQIIFDFTLVPQLRNFFLKVLGADIGKSVVILKVTFSNVYKTGFSNLKIGNYVFLGDEVMLDLSGKIILQEHVTISNRTALVTHTNVGYKNHPLQKYFPRFIENITLKRGCFIGTGVTIMPGVVVGECAVVGAGAVVVNNIPNWTVVAGVPAKKIRIIKHER